MKKNLQFFKNFALLLVLVVTTAIANAAARTASVTGNWNSTATWGGASVPVAGDDVTINSGVTVTVTANAACATVTFLSTATVNSIITINSGISLTVSGAVTIPRPGTSTNSIVVGAGTLNAGSIAFTNGGTNVRHRITISTGTLDVSGNIVGSVGNTSGTISMSGAGTVKIGGSIFNAADGTLTPGTGTVEYDGAAAQIIQDFAYTDLTVSGAGAKTTAAAIDISGNLLIATGSTLSLGATDLNINVNANRSATINGTLNINGNGRLIETGTSTKTLVLGPNSILNITDVGGSTLPVLNAYTFDPTSTVVFGATDAQTVENSVTYGNLTVSGGNTKTLETSGGTMTFAGDVLIVAGTTLDGNDKTINVGGDFIKNGSFTQANTTLVLNGTAAQSLRGSTAIALNSLTINNTIAGSTIAVTVDTIINIAGAATFTDGIVSTSTTEYLAFADNATATGTGLSQTTDASFVAGPVLKTGNDAFVFPVGALVTATGGGYMPLTITAPDNIADALSCEYVRGNATAIQTNGFTSPILNVSKCDYWNLNETNDAGAGTSISVTLSWDGGSPCNNKPFITNVSALTVAHYNSGTSKWEQAGTGGPAPSGTPTTGSVTRTGVSVFSPFSLGNTLNGANPLPVTFFDVKAFEKNSGVQVEWVNLTEKDLASYSVERSVNGRDFTAISTLAARSNQNDAQSYNNFDASPFAGTSFYRIKAVEVDGKISYSKLLKVEIGKTQKGIALYPNPVTGSDLTIGFTAVKGQYTLGVVNSVGQKVFTQTLSHQGGTVSQSISLPASVKPGMYTMLLTGDNYRETKIFVIQ